MERATGDVAAWWEDWLAEQHRAVAWWLEDKAAEVQGRPATRQPKELERVAGRPRVSEGMNDNTGDDVAGRASQMEEAVRAFGHGQRTQWTGVGGPTAEEGARGWEWSADGIRRVGGSTSEVAGARADGARQADGEAAGARGAAGLEVPEKLSKRDPRNVRGEMEAAGSAARSLLLNPTTTTEGVVDGARGAQRRGAGSAGWAATGVAPRRRGDAIDRRWMGRRSEQAGWGVDEKVVGAGGGSDGDGWVGATRWRAVAGGEAGWVDERGERGQWGASERSAARRGVSSGARGEARGGIRDARDRSGAVESMLTELLELARQQQQVLARVAGRPVEAVVAS